MTDLSAIRRALPAIRERAEKATAGPWNETYSTVYGPAIWGANGEILFRVEATPYRSNLPGPQWQYDNDFVCNARSDIPSLLSLLDAQDNLLREYVRHKKNCRSLLEKCYPNRDYSCDCGLAERLKELGMEETQR